MSSYGGSSSPPHAKHRKTSRCLATLNTVDDTARASGRALQPHLDEEEEPAPRLGERIGTDAKRPDMSGAIGSCVEHVEGVDALGWATEDDTEIECWCEGISYP
jgi:hypothetical protein